MMEDSKITYRELSERVNRIVASLRQAGGKEGDSVAILDSYSIEVYCAAITMECCLLLLNPFAQAEELTTKLNDSECETLFFGKSFISLIEGVHEYLKNIPVSRFVCISNESMPGSTSYPDFLERVTEVELDIEIDVDDIFCYRGVLAT